MSRPPPPPPPDAELDAIFRELSEVQAGASCPRSARCCRLRASGHVPYLWPVEARRVVAAVKRRGGRLPDGGEEGDCRLLLPDGSCSIHADRPFGCRTYFCEDATLPEGSKRREIEDLSRRLRAISDRAGDRDLLPLTTILGRYFDREGRIRR